MGRRLDRRRAVIAAAIGGIDCAPSPLAVPRPGPPDTAELGIPYLVATPGVKQ